MGAAGRLAPAGPHPTAVAFKGASILLCIEKPRTTPEKGPAVTRTPPNLAAALRRADFDAMAAMEARFYGEDLITPAEDSWRWYLRHPFSIVAERGEDGRVAGFANLFPVRREVFEGIVAGTFNDADLGADDIVDPWSDGSVGPLHMFLSCIVVDELHRGGACSRRLLQAAAAQFSDVADRALDIALDAATPSGERLARRYGFGARGASDHGTTVWVRDYAGFARMLLG